MPYSVLLLLQCRVVRDLSVSTASCKEPSQVFISGVTHKAVFHHGDYNIGGNVIVSSGQQHNSMELLSFVR
jgi:hypothetical protein